MMIILNITAIVAQDLDPLFKDWVLHTYLPTLKTNVPLKQKQLLKVLYAPNEGQTYCIQFTFETESDMNAFRHESLTSLQSEIKARFSDQVLFFESVMQVQ